LIDNVMATVPGKPRSPRRKLWLLLAALTAICATAVAASIYLTAQTEPKPPGDELSSDQAPYGWYTSRDVGSTFTDGFNLLTVTPQARGPLRLVSARPLMDNGGTVRVIGILARVNPDMLPPGFEVGSFQSSPGFPPTFRDAAGAVPLEGLTIQPPKQGETRWIELQIGYEVLAPGRSARRGVELVYEYQGAQHKALIPSYLAVCAPATATCQPEYDS
jgi:hypothetical protein